MNRIFLLAVILCMLLPVSGFAQSDRGEEVKKLMLGLESSSSAKRVQSAKIISRSGLRAPALYQKVSALLKAGYAQEHEKDHVDEMAWMCKALAASGDLQYRELLDAIAEKAPSFKLKKYARQSSGLIEHYAQRSQVLNEIGAWDEELSDVDNRFINMLKSTDIGLKRDAAKGIVRSLKTDKKVFDVVASALLEMAKDTQPNFQQVDTMAWLCKALAVSGDNQYIEVLEGIWNNTKSIKLKSYASKSIKSLR